MVPLVENDFQLAAVVENDFQLAAVVENDFQLAGNLFRGYTVVVGGWMTDEEECDRFRHFAFSSTEEYDEYLRCFNTLLDLAQRHGLSVRGALLAVSQGLIPDEDLDLWFKTYRRFTELDSSGR